MAVFALWGYHWGYTFFYSVGTAVGATIGEVCSGFTGTTIGEVCSDEMVRDGMAVSEMVYFILKINKVFFCCWF